MTILLSNKTHFKLRNIIRDREGHFIMIKGSNPQKYITIIHLYASNNSLRIHEAKNDRIERKNREQNTQRPQYSTLNN